MSLLRHLLKGERKPRLARRRNKIQPGLESLESRVVLYSASGNAWPNPQLITISFMPDGTSLGGGVTSNLISSFNSRSNLVGKWQNIILDAAQVWAQYTNINFAVVPDDGAPAGSGADEQGTPGFGDIRIGGYNFGSSTLALTYQPPSVNNFSIAGDMTFNTGESFNLGSTYDLYTVAMHEFGHALGLNESSVSNAIEYGTYTGVKYGLSSDDIAGIRAIYSANAIRTADVYNVSGAWNGNMSIQKSITSMINPCTLTALVPNLDITQPGQAEYFSFVTPCNTGSTLQIDVQSSGLSLLAPKLTFYGSDAATVLATLNGAGQYGTTLTLTLSGICPNEPFYFSVTGADTTQMGTGRYAVGINLRGATPPMEASPIIAVPNGNPEHTGGGQADGSDGHGPYSGAPIITGITPDNGASNSDGVTNVPNVSILGTAPDKVNITVYCNGNAIGTITSKGDSTWSFTDPATLSNGTYLFTAAATDSAGYTTPLSSYYQVTIDTHTPKAPVLNDISPDTGASSTDGITNVKNPTFSGTSEPLDTITLYNGRQTNGFATTQADINGHWSYTLPSSGWGDGTYAVTATATDLAGTTSASSSTLTVVIATQPPQQPNVTSISPDTGKSGDGVTTARNLIFSGTAEAGVAMSVYLNGTLLGITTSGTTGGWTFNNTAMTLANGTYAITAQATDIAGNISKISNAFNLTVETVQSPVIAGVSLNGGSGQQSLSIIGTASPNNSVQVSLNGALLGTVNANAQGNWSYNYVPSSTQVASGIYNFSAVALDSTANASALSPTFKLQVGGGPTASVSTYASGILSGQATPGSLVTIVDGCVVIGVVTAGTSGNWQLATTLSVGNNSIMVEATNSAGDTSLLSTALGVNVQASGTAIVTAKVGTTTVTTKTTV